MNILHGKNIVLGITGGIAAYKTPELVRRLKDHGADVRVVMTEGAKAFITPLTLQAVSANSVSDSLLDTQAELAMGHIELAKWADFILIAPATADTIARITVGMANDLLTTVCLASAAKITVAPAMNQQMWHAPITQENVARLTERGINVWGPGQGEQACGDVGFGRMLEVDQLVELTCQHFLAQNTAQILKGQHWLITAGPTREAIDPVRYISNHSSGKMGFAIAKAAADAGATVTLVSGPVALVTPSNVNRINVISAENMHQQVMAHVKSTNVFIACAAVADYKIAEVAQQKIKKSNDNMQINLVKNPDIVADVAALADKPFTVGFAAETQDVEHYAKDKLTRKNLDLIAANNVAASNQGFNSDTNALTVFSHAKQFELPLASKQQIAQQLVALIAQQRDENQ
ncbi:bifunctional phosphopantothenoylcysteine decarboxylase/phosphopantothenate--cysteine ligase CoaBC [Thalassotalea piscium]|uniref:Coenzyme A biosynthesis bifunctional protein CoaBC n=1 Tax=Thalassotalea piscium TaxID=1230533 RepID=A0A7X0NEM8_9GAMM|nr:bifunctional phosphopantothenoylcysteine decarboxylase/phosphopantothenate--cysteine ligase CoaBC [Thalassotalea piscium]MBB6542049.1 phosphopantothenoylcysteine decarboxylase/phosphopantothenate--cysteine ligase [Thalassotalea piscium]